MPRLHVIRNANIGIFKNGCALRVCMRVCMRVYINKDMRCVFMPSQIVPVIQVRIRQDRILS